ncbi:tetratricopeptide repeat protein [bacterium]|nr:MAG: tetratricopeptide repeat protein [bacterium]
MLNYPKDITSKRLAAALFISLSAITYLFSQIDKLEAADNHGYIESRDIPEVGSESVVAEKGLIRQPVSLKEEGLTAMQKQARIYRQDGLESQRLGNLDSAMASYQKAIESDPGYAVAYNDLGVVYEAKGLLDRAEESYLKSVQIDPDYLSAYSNLALFYENKRDLNKAAYYWNKRVELGFLGDPWTEKAKKRLEDLAEVIPELKQKVVEEQILDLSKKVEQEKQNRKLEEAKEAKRLLESAAKLEKKSRYQQALAEVDKALALAPQNKEALAMMEGIKVKLRKQEQAAAVEEMRLHFQTAVAYYQQDNPQAAKQELDKLKELAK